MDARARRSHPRNVSVTVRGCTVPRDAEGPHDLLLPSDVAGRARAVAAARAHTAGARGDTRLGDARATPDAGGGPGRRRHAARAAHRRDVLGARGGDARAGTGGVRLMAIPSPEREPPSRPNTVLLVDDDPSALHAIALLFEHHGWSVVATSDARESIETYGQVQPDIVMLDRDMPGLSGMEVLRVLKDRDPDSTVIMLSGTSDIDIAV